MEKHRVEAFSDGVFAIAITLLILEIKLPKDISNIGEAILATGPHIIVWLFAFLIIGMYWVAHHHMMHYMKKIDRNALWINNLTLATVAFMPFPAALLGEHYSDPMAILLYSITLCLCNISGAWFWAYQSKHGGWVESPEQEIMAKRTFWVHLIPAGIYAIAWPLAYLSWQASLVLICLVPAFFILPNPLAKRILGG